MIRRQLRHGPARQGKHPSRADKLGAAARDNAPAHQLRKLRRSAQGTEPGDRLPQVLALRLPFPK